ncbi:metallophosphoesterase family protein [Jiulongibacter sediminis]|uniref:Calcineurin-like phosphoesterase domain-containing protein n=1 Tax=Jiulongibacter sediminis TaxID=1605367 RepID=A0A0P7BR97_9BACT|nr:metallophosphoesterase [Jiulongibacter sediminis]KPM46774.1 hypothetical protein AFM12_18650 [Jiulongibacter sediminis]TBX21678.1 hypothetical protein TK44_18655 [Jiulongibacter sediminis]
MSSQNRRSFIKNATALTMLGVLPGKGLFDFAQWSAQKGLLRIIIGSDSHYGQPNTAFEEMTSTFVNKANRFAQSHPCDFCVINGDLIHDDPKWMPEVKSVYDGLDIPYYVTKGNHDRVSDRRWEEIWQMPTNLSFVKKKTGFILANTSNEKGEYLMPDLAWLKKQLDQFSNLKTVVLIIHIPQASWTANGIDSPEFFNLLGQYNNIKAVFHGHEHDQDGVRVHQDIPYIFDSHIGGSWGTDYCGFRVLEISKKGELLTYLMNPDEEKGREEL